jgi:hypothetical protein
VNTREKLVINLEIKLEDEIVVILLRAEDAVRLAFGNNLADDAAVFYIEFVAAGFLRPARKVPAVEQLDPALPGEYLLHSEDCEREKNAPELSHKGSPHIQGHGRFRTGYKMWKLEFHSGC